MSAEHSGSLPPVELRRRIPARREVVFATWTDPTQVRQWLGGPGVEVHSARIDLRQSGEYEYELTMPDGARSTILGSFITVQAPEKLVYSWAVENAAGRSPTTQVTVEFFDYGEETEVVLLHEGFSHETTRERHQAGWVACFTNLEELIRSVS